MDLQLAEILVPGLKQFKSGKTNEGLIWLIGSVVGYLMGFMPGLIIHGIYIWKYFGNKIMTTISGTASSSNGAVPNDTLMEPTNYSATKQRGFNFGLSQNCRSCGAKLILMEQGSKSGTCGKCELAARGLLDSNEQVLFHQGASYRGGLQVKWLIMYPILLSSWKS